MNTLTLAPAPRRLPSNTDACWMTVFLLLALTTLAGPLAANTPPGPPVVGVRASVPETREPYCDPAICETVVLSLVPIQSILPGYTVGFPGRAAAIIVDGAAPRPPCLRLADGLFNLCVPVVDANSQCFRVEITRDLAKWMALGDVAVKDDAIHFVDPDAPDWPRGFYRLVPVPCEP